MTDIAYRLLSGRLLSGFIAAIGALALTACIPPSPEPAPAPAAPPVTAPAPTPSPVPAPVPAPARTPVPVTPALANWEDAPVTPGDWTYVSEAEETLAVFGTDRSASGVALIIRCDLTTRRIGIARSGAASGQVQMLVRTETQERLLTAVPADGPAPLIAVELSENDALLDAMAFSKGRFAIEAPGIAPLYAPAWPEITRVIEDCRN